MTESTVEYLFTQDIKADTLEPERTRRFLARGLDELQREAMQTERALLQWLNQVRAIQGKRPVIVPHDKRD